MANVKTHYIEDCKVPNYRYNISKKPLLTMDSTSLVIKLNN